MAMLEGHAMFFVAVFGFILDLFFFARAWLTLLHGCIMLHLRKENSSEAQLGLQAGLHGGPKTKYGITCE